MGHPRDCHHTETTLAGIGDRYIENSFPGTLMPRGAMACSLPPNPHTAAGDPEPHLPAPLGALPV